MKRRAGYKVDAHVHTQQERHINCYQEVLFVRTGKINVKLFSRDNNFVTSRVLSAGDCILFAAGGHSVEIIEDADVIEVKQDPFMGEDKVMIERTSASLGDLRQDT